MDAFFARSPRFRDRFLDTYHNPNDASQLDNLVEVELTGGTTGEILLHRGFTWEDFYSVANGKFVWMNPNVYIDLSPNCTRHFYRSFLAVFVRPELEDEGDRGLFRIGVYASSIASATIACDILLQLLTTSEIRRITLTTDDVYNDFPVSRLAFSHFLIHSSHSLKVLELNSLRMDACHCHAIDASTRTDLQIDLDHSCGISELGESVLLESIRQNRGPTRLDRVNLDARRLANALRGNNIFSPWSTASDGSTERQEYYHSFFQALAENEGLVKLVISHSIPISDEHWDVLWQSISRHPRLENLSMSLLAGDKPLTDAQKTRRTHAILDALRVNTVLHTIRLCRQECDLEMLDNMIRPRLLVYRYRLRVAAISKERRAW
jgi:hypothetical protein